ncbi:hypothetical protein VL20_3434 [Microcystis panniformis FACHB-1757]|uniref:Uncharacterized protein n=1 Tax=Microcystis panniformis FACHB-1757 TaxID=1638788 RepID=A0A0K1S384_9CHRO|nr:hypothetical protein VL20_3434 [Microcystis panniformis FACHB-1757]
MSLPDLLADKSLFFADFGFFIIFLYYIRLGLGSGGAFVSVAKGTA